MVYDAILKLAEKFELLSQATWTDLYFNPKNRNNLNKIYLLSLGILNEINKKYFATHNISLFQPFKLKTDLDPERKGYYMWYFKMPEPSIDASIENKQNYFKIIGDEIVILKSMFDTLTKLKTYMNKNKSVLTSGISQEDKDYFNTLLLDINDILISLPKVIQQFISYRSGYKNNLT